MTEEDDADDMRASRGVGAVRGRVLRHRGAGTEGSPGGRTKEKGLCRRTARTPRVVRHAHLTGATRCLRTSDEQRPSPIDGNRSEVNGRSTADGSQNIYRRGGRTRLSAVRRAGAGPAEHLGRGQRRRDRGGGALATTSAGLTRSLGAAADRLDRDRAPAAVARALVRRAARELLGRGSTGATSGEGTYGCDYTGS
ncbi:hypothetical protein FSY75_35895 [Streptomyces sp. TR1341]|nr:hypothetical protein [Streptomyces sp. TR1341]